MDGSGRSSPSHQNDEKCANCHETQHNWRKCPKRWKSGNEVISKYFDSQILIENCHLKIMDSSIFV
jgi:hypothetical protein